MCRVHEGSRPWNRGRRGIAARSRYTHDGLADAMRVMIIKTHAVHGDMFVADRREDVGGGPAPP
jgi:hypothetical protein